MDRFFSRMRVKARRLDREEKLEPGLIVSFEDPADFLEVITPARVRILKEIDGRTVAIFALAYNTDMFKAAGIAAPVVPRRRIISA